MGRVIDKDTWRIIEITITNYKSYQLALSEYEESIILSTKTESHCTHYDLDYTIKGLPPLFSMKKSAELNTIRKPRKSEPKKASNIVSNHH